ncbi:dTDP-4-dehydrorhamnose reductase [Bacillus canaveralius]|uniref:dTDP-4-dehydrorhamnose reductase n=1 Tax=Bacillus canaveralius TaxID=1403243 RepID=A0A2N5GMJ3_9BACI|nr:dTDP-4-dehydrorhamnose reductase [Bacillus canaveralius]PLR83146.1 dTDP-4-dehydrorhamnose reductase [Bacillus canaveralius]PLR94064.1 dTDP-4-dehydrorhamnose reductase [Bacillus canaveralius]RSK54135.1 dTDP-4-dehydrorhamnose reductase [Bacillus canaveralius]
MIVVVTGVQGQLGYDVVKELEKKNHQVYGTDRSQLDITSEADVNAFIDEVKPDAIIHCAAYTNVDRAEEDKETAYNVNALGTQFLAQAAKKAGAKMLLVSTDYVFDGTADKPYETDHPTKPLGVYGETKLAGEQLLTEILDEYFIVRTAWVFGINGHNFVKTMLRLGEERGEVGVVHDQVGSPTYTPDLAKFLVELIETTKYGVYHATNSGECSWYDFAVEIFKQAGMDVKVNPLTTDQFPRPASRPKYSILSKKKIEEQGLKMLPDWKKALSEYLQELKL